MFYLNFAVMFGFRKAWSVLLNWVAQIFRYEIRFGLQDMIRQLPIPKNMHTYLVPCSERACPLLVLFPRGTSGYLGGRKVQEANRQLLYIWAGYWLNTLSVPVP